MNGSSGRDEKQRSSTKFSVVDKKSDKKSGKSTAAAAAAATSEKKSHASKSKVTKDVKKVPEKPLSKRNVMNSIHNVTVASPPSSAGSREMRSVSMIDVKIKPKEESSRQRSRTRTIEPEESILQKIERLNRSPTRVNVVPVVKEPVAFEINFEEAKKPKVTEKVEVVQQQNDYEYESDFESYESDFEDEVPSTASEQQPDEEMVNEEDSNDDDDNKTSDDVEDSGNETNENTKKTSASSHFESIDATTVNSNSHDSVLSFDRTVFLRNREIFKRGKEIMKKVIFDTMSFDIYEMKPLPYDTFIAMYGDRNMVQISTQIDSLQISDETQTDDIEKAEKWIQYPARFTSDGVKVPKSRLYNEEKSGVGEGKAEKWVNEDDESEKFERIVEKINNFSKLEEPLIETTKYFDSREYRNFLDTSELFISRALEKSDREKSFQSSTLEICDGFIQLKFDDCKILKNTKITNIYANQKVNSFFFTINRRAENEQEFVCLWDSIHITRPLKIFQSWSQITCIEIHEHQKDFIVGGCDDGTIFVWDATDCGDDSTSPIKPCEIASPNSEEKISESIVAISRLKYPKLKSSQSNFTQFCSLNKVGIVVIWSLSQIEFKEDDLTSEKFQSSYLNFVQANSRVKLVKNISVDLNLQLRQVFEKTKRKKSAFEKTRYYFENDLFSDKVLKELQEISTTQENKSNEDIPSFTGCETSFSEIYASTHSNHFVALSRLNFTDTRRVFTSDFSTNSITAMKIHPKRSNVMAVGHLNGDVRFMKIFEDEKIKFSLSKNKKKLQRTKNFEAEELNSRQTSVDSSKSANSEELKIIFDKNIFNPFKDWQGAVSKIEFNERGSLMFAIIGNHLRVFNCNKNCEIDCRYDLSLLDMRCIRGADCCEYLVSYDY